MTRGIRDDVTSTIAQTRSERIVRRLPPCIAVPGLAIRRGLVQRGPAKRQIPLGATLHVA
jgi:hypothetical protein